MHLCKNIKTEKNSKDGHRYHSNDPENDRK